MEGLLSWPHEPIKLTNPQRDLLWQLVSLYRKHGPVWFVLTPQPNPKTLDALMNAGFTELNVSEDETCYIESYRVSWWMRNFLDNDPTQILKPYVQGARVALPKT